jgi:hypothetical protein
MEHDFEQKEGVVNDMICQKDTVIFLLQFVSVFLLIVH